MKLANDEVRELAIALVNANAEREVIDILKRYSFWDDPANWRLYSDDENNFRIIGSQQARPEAALVEKLVNSIDARLMGACLRSGIKPDSGDAPQTIWHARKKFFGNIDRTVLANEITLAVTGARGHQQGMPCLTICDTGEGQSPSDVPNTFLSLDRSNKLRIPFVQGKFNMGGTGALMFCGDRKLQLIITRRDPTIVPFANQNDAAASLWSVVIVRRESPPKGPGGRLRWLESIPKPGLKKQWQLRMQFLEQRPLLIVRNVVDVREVGWPNLILVVTKYERALQRVGHSGFDVNVRL